MGARLAARLPELEFDCGLGTGALLADDVAVEPVQPVDGTIGIGRVDIDEDALRRLAAPSPRTAWWRARVERCYAQLTTPPAPT